MVENLLMLSPLFRDVLAFLDSPKGQVPPSPIQMSPPSPPPLMPVVRPPVVPIGGGVAQSKGVGGTGRQPKSGGAPFTEVPLSGMRRTIAKRLSEAKVCVCACGVCVCVCVWACVCGRVCV